MDHEVRVRYCNIDYDREIAIVAELTENGRRKILGVTRVSLEPDRKTGEITFIIADPWQGLGLGTKMVDHAIEICKGMKVEKIYGIMLPDNHRAINLMKKTGFRVEYLEDNTVKATLNLREEDQTKCPEPTSPETMQTRDISHVNKEKKEKETEGPIGA